MKIKYKVTDNYCSVEAWGFKDKDEDTGDLRKQLLKLKKGDVIEINVVKKHKKR